MHDIKFRAWDREKKKMYEVENICFYGHKSVTLQYNPVIKKAIEDIEIMQCTGMKDSTGKEIYEGDIVVVGQDTGNKYDRYIMTFNDDSHSYLAKQQGTLGSYIGPGYWNDKLMVIGNIYDNPEMLGGDAK